MYITSVNMKKDRSWLFILFIIAWTAIQSVPYLNSKLPGVIIAAVMLPTYFYLYNNQRNLFVGHLGVVLPFALMLIIDFLFDYVTGVKVKTPQFIYELMQFLLFPLIVLYIKRNNFQYYSKVLIIALSICYLLTSITTYLGLDLFPAACRQLANSQEKELDSAMVPLYKSLNIGGFDFIYSLVLISPLLVYTILRSKKKYYKLLAILVYIGLFLLVIKAQFTTAVLCYVLSSLCFLMKNQKSSRTFWFLLVIGGLFVIFRGIIGDILIDISGSFESANISNRFEDIGHVIQGEETTSSSADIDSRQIKYGMAWDAFCSSPIWGTGKGVGGHSFILGYMAKYGIIGLGLVIYLFMRIYGFMVRPLRGSILYNCMFFIFFLQIIMAMLNPMVFYIVPLYIAPIYAIVYQSNIKNEL